MKSWRRGLRPAVLGSALLLGCGEPDSAARIMPKPTPAEPEARTPEVPFLVSKEKLEEWLVFPDVEGWMRISPHLTEYAADSYTIGYDSVQDSMSVTFYVYNRGERAPKNAGSPAVEAELDGSEEALRALVMRGLYRRVQRLHRGAVHIGPHPAQRSSFLITKDTGEVVYSDTYLTTYRGYFVKVRCTFRDQNDGSSTASLDRLLRELGGRLAGLRYEAP